MTIDEAAEVSGIGRNTMRKLISWGKLPVLLVGRKKIIRSDTLDRFMTANQGRNLLNQSEVRKVEYNKEPSATESEIHLLHKFTEFMQGVFRPCGELRAA